MAPPGSLGSTSGGPTPPCSLYILDIADYGLGDRWARGSHLGSQSALGSQSSLQKRRTELRACYWAGDPHSLRKELTPQSSKKEVWPHLFTVTEGSKSLLLFLLPLLLLPLSALLILPLSAGCLLFPLLCCLPCLHGWGQWSRHL